MEKKSNYHAARIGVDLVGSDAHPEDLLKGVIQLLSELEEPIEITVFATQETFDKVSCGPEIHCETITEIISMDDDPLSSIRLKKDSSINVGLAKLAKFELDAFVSAGNTGALMAGSKIHLQMLPGIDRPALAALMPSKGDPVAVLDVGANVNAKAENLVQSAIMGIAYQKARGVEHPTVGLLNIGEEERKGTPELQKAYKQLQELNHNTPVDAPVFLGNVEGKDVFHGNIDVLVTDGFTGNVFLKTSEGIAAFIFEHLQDLGPIESMPIVKNLLKTLRHRLHYAEYPGAILCGVDGIVIKCHGDITPKAIQSSITSASRLVRHFFLEKIKSELTRP
ncbi:MAG: Phosphate acyltransferase [Chlamydiae bacterium]|nr:Phosphate acyltransferase [Chlamydiota bacterium]